MRSSTPRYGNGNHYSGNASSDTDDYPAQPRFSPEMEAEYANIYAKKAAAHKARLAADDEKQIQLLEQATIRASEEQKRRDAEAMIKNREFAMLDRQKSQAAWEARCQIKPVMSDEEITTCKEVWSKPAPERRLAAFMQLIPGCTTKELPAANRSFELDPGKFPEFDFFTTKNMALIGVDRNYSVNQSNWG